MSNMRSKKSKDGKGAKGTSKGKTPNKVIYIGNFRPAHSTENHIALSFESMGWEVIRYQEDDIPMFSSNKINEITRNSAGAKFLLWTRTWAEVEDNVWQIIKNIKIPTVSYHLDLYLGIKRGKDIHETPFFNTDYVFSADGGNDKKFEKLGVNHFFLSPGVLEEECVKGEYNKKFDFDVVFLGSYYYHNEWEYRKILIEWLAKTYGNHFQLYGGDQVFGLYGKVWGQEKNDLFASAKIVMGDSLFSKNYWSDRIPETIGRGGFHIHPYIEDMDQKKEFKYFKHFVPYQYNDFKTLKMVIDYYIKHDKEREIIRNEGMEYVRTHHTYRHKLEYVLSILEKNGWKKNT